MVKSENFSNVLTSELLLKQGDVVEQDKCKAELIRRLKSIEFTDEQIEQFIATDEAVINAYKSDTPTETLMAKKEFFDIMAPCELKIKKLTISEMLLASEQATNEYQVALSGQGGEKYFGVISEYARQLIGTGYHTAIDKLKKFGLSEDSIKKFIFAEWQVIRRVTFNDEGAMDAWGDPDKYLS